MSDPNHVCDDVQSEESPLRFELVRQKAYCESDESEKLGDHQMQLGLKSASQRPQDAAKTYFSLSTTLIVKDWLTTVLSFLSQKSFTLRPAALKLSYCRTFHRDNVHL